MKDNQFIRGKVPMTKEEVRCISLHKLRLGSNQRFLDVGAGTGSISIEAACMFPALEVVAVEENPNAICLIKENCLKFQVEHIQVIQDKAPIKGLGYFDSIFIGGSGGNLQAILEWSFQSLAPEGQIVLNFILLENAEEAIAWLQRQGHPHEVTHLQVHRRQLLGKGHYLKPENPVIIIETRKNI